MRSPDFRQHLQQELIRRTSANPRYSARALARALQVDFSTLCKLLNGKRPIGRNVIIRLGTRMGLGTEQIQTYVDRGSAARADRGRYRRLAPDVFATIADWQHHALLELTRVDGFAPDAAWAARALGLPRSEIEASLERLRRAGLLEITAAGEWIDLSGGRTTTLPATRTSTALRRLQNQLLAKAGAALEEIPIEERDQSSITLAIDAARIPEAKLRIARFRRELAQFLGRGEKRQAVYAMTISLFPLSRSTPRPPSS